MTKPTTLRDLAARLGMHKSTVSLALSGKGTIAPETRRKVLETAREIGYEPNPLAQRLAHGQRSASVCLFSGALDVGLATEKILLIQGQLNAQALEVPIHISYDPSGEHGEAQAAQVRQICRQRPRAIVCAAQRAHPLVYQELAKFRDGGGVVVAYDTPSPIDCDQVIFDREDNAYRAAQYLLERGHRRIGLGMTQFNGAAAECGAENLNDPQAWRLRGFRKALRDYGLDLRDDWFFRNAPYEPGGAGMARQFLQLRDRPTALAIVNDYAALAFMVEVMRAGVRIPQDLSVIGHDNQPIAAYCPVPLTTMTQPSADIARAVAGMVTERLASSDPLPCARRIHILGELVERSSVATLPE